MSTVSGPGELAHDVVESRPVRLLGRVGLVAYGVVHLLIAGLVIQVPFGAPDEQADKKGALGEIAATAPGLVLLWIITVGLAALVAWQLAEAVWGHRGLPSGTRARRTAINLGEAVIFAVLAYSAGSIAATGGAPSMSKSFAAAVFELPGGRYLVGLAGLALVAGGAYAVYRGVTEQFLEELDLRGEAARRRRLITRLGQVGWSALGVVYGLPGVLLLVAAVQHDPKEPVGLDAGLQALARQPLGAPLLVLLALGLTAFGVFCLVDARYRKS
ncbi:MAG TPA: DUF1206 domain-containing protein [Pseudonocardia sp.]|nr:DUF1206 domain-containing protein [Pseudonocardia sp.]